MPDRIVRRAGWLASLAIVTVLSSCRFPATDWPLEPTGTEHEIATSLAEFQGYPTHSPYFHKGSDILGDPAPNGPWVRNVREGTVTLSLPGAGSDQNGVTIESDDGDVYRYWHLDYDSVQQPVRDAETNGTNLPTDSQTAQLFAWPTCGFNHLHYQIHDSSGYIDPALTLTPRNDVSDPILANIYFVENTTATRLPSVPGTTMPLLNGDVDVLVHAYDYQFGAHQTGVIELSYWVIDASTGNMAKNPTELRFGDLPFDADGYVTDAFRTAYPFESRSDYCGTEYFYYVLTNVDGNGQVISDASGFWDTTTLPNGVYDVYATVKDPSNNEFTWNRPVEIAN